MSTPSLSAFLPTTSVSPLMLADQLLTLAQDAERSGLHGPAQRLLKLAYAIYGEKPAPT
jgi:hypothetical protein